MVGYSKVPSTRYVRLHVSEEDGREYVATTTGNPKRWEFLNFVQSPFLVPRHLYPLPIAKPGAQLQYLELLGRHGASTSIQDESLIVYRYMEVADRGIHTLALVLAEWYLPCRWAPTLLGARHLHQRKKKRASQVCGLPPMAWAVN